MSKKTITIADILNRIRNIKYVMMHKDGGTKYLSLNELTNDGKKLEINWFEVTMFQGQKCIEFNLKSLNNKLRVWWIPQVGSSNRFYIPVKSVEEGKKVMDLLAAYDMFQLQNNIKEFKQANGSLSEAVAPINKDILLQLYKNANKI